MPLPDGLARFNRRITNPFVRTFAGWVPGLAIVEHRGRSSGRAYRTPVNAFRTEEGFVLALTYGPDRDWVRNVLAAGGCTLVRHGRRIPLAGARLEALSARRDAVPTPVRWILRLLGVDGVMALSRLGP